MTALPVEAAARLARTDTDAVRAALDTGDLPSLEERHVEPWARARVAAAIAKGQRP